MLVSLGLDHRKARLEVRERFLLDDAAVTRIRAELADRGVEELVLNRTCNRVEVYCWWPDTGITVPDREWEICRVWSDEVAPDAEELRANARFQHGGDTVRHLLRVAAGLESQILGDIHILGQLRRAFREAVEARSVGAHLHRLFETALCVGRRVKRETQLMATRNGVGSEAARRASAQWGGLEGRHCVVIGCGKSGTHAARSLHEHGAAGLTVVNRTVSRAEKLASDLGGARAAGLDALPGVLAGADVVVVATGASEAVLTESLLRQAEHGARPRGGAASLLVIDVSVPRNVETAVGRLPGVELVDLDSLHPEAAEVEKSRLAAIPEAEALVDEGVGEYAGWLELKRATGALKPLQQVLSEICRREVAHLAGDSPSARRTADRIVAGVMARPMTALRAASERGEPLHDAAGALGGLFTGAERA